jgi:hypothetical protein
MSDEETARRFLISLGDDYGADLVARIAAELADQAANSRQKS